MSTAPDSAEITSADSGLGGPTPEDVLWLVHESIDWARVGPDLLRRVIERMRAL
ncbi:hypothetical protein HUO13_00855 [Saccharopolyspora erythraea]|uniref:hypothetical protein n=1 Tax=Saccharopolyspora erythraea TaxID=1836 RepID=UPI001BACB0EE|nr:hypothetical protein [Saccharopolyspora erythraea]QUG99542.1 hypothetical protein HUO13_00855 [Saccharopolyspora erythraea]